MNLKKESKALRSLQMTPSHKNVRLHQAISQKYNKVKPIDFKRSEKKFETDNRIACTLQVS